MPNLNNSTNVLGIKVSQYKLKNLFKNLYKIPSFQRSYKWEVVNMKDLWEDLEFAFENNRQFYFLGSVITHAKETEPRKTVIDGQQRITSLIIILGALMSFTFNKDELREQKSILRNLLIHNLDSSDEPEFTLLHADDEITLELNSFFNQLKNESEINFGESNTNFVKNYSYIKEKIEEKFSNNETTVTFKNFVKFLIEDNIFSYSETTNFTDAFFMFERHNDRGIDLPFSDLLKHYLIGLALELDNPNQTLGNIEDLDEIGRELNNKWLEANKLLKDTKFEFDTFLIYFLNAKFKKDFKKSTALRELRNSEYDIEPNSFVDEVLNKAKWFVKIRKGVNKDNSPNISMQYINQYLSFQQHYQVLLAAEDLEIDSFNKLTIYLESLIFISTWYGTEGSSLEKPMNNLINYVDNDKNVLEKCYENSESNVQCIDDQSLDLCKHYCNHESNGTGSCTSVIEHEIRKLIDTRIKQAEENLIDPEFLIESATWTNKKYIIFRIQQQFQIMAASNQTKENSLERYNSQSNEVDHILEENNEEIHKKFLNVNLLSEENKKQIKKMTNRIGNLTLLTREENQHMFKNFTPKEKFQGKKTWRCSNENHANFYHEAQTDNLCQVEDCDETLIESETSFINATYELTKVMSNNNFYNQRTKGQKIIDKYRFRTHTDWNEDEIIKRENAQFWILSQALLTVINPHKEINHEIDKNYINENVGLPSNINN